MTGLNLKMKNKNLNISKLIKEYIDNEIASFQLAKKYKCSNTKIRRILRLNNIKIRNCKESQKKYQKRTEILCEYCKKKIIRLICEYKKSKHHFCSHKCFYSYNCGKNNNKYIDGRSFLEQSIWKLSKYKLWREQIRQRDNYTCQICNKNKIYLEVHHKIPLLYIVELFQLKTIKEVINCKLLWDVNWGITLCKKCHNKVHPEKGCKK